LLLGLALSSFALATVVCNALIDLGDTFPLKVVNDAAEIRYLRECKDQECTKFGSPSKHDPGDSFTFNAVVDSEFTEIYLIQTPAGKVVGCLIFHFPEVQTHLTVRMTDAISCPGGHATPKIP
jgi:hypothetical protein